MNEDRKMAFINEYYEGSATSYMSIFKSVEACEEHFQKDLCEISKQQLVPFLTNALGESYGTGVQRLAVLNKYYEYCWNHGFSGAQETHLSYSDIQKSHDIARNMVGSPEMLHCILNNIFPSVSDGEYSNILRCCIWLIFSGVKINDTASLRVCDINLDAMAITYRDSVLPIYNDAVEVLRFCMESNFITIRGPKGNYKKGRIDCDLLLRSFNPVSWEKLQNGIAKHVKDSVKCGRCPVNITCHTVWKSGIFYRTYLNDDDRILASAYSKEREPQVPKSADKNAYKQYYNIKREYLAWESKFKLGNNIGV